MRPSGTPSARRKKNPRSLQRASPNTINPHDITVVILTRNEERNLPRALMSLPRDINVLVVDAESYDRTREYAADAGATVIQRPWSDFVEAREFALAHATTPWVLMLDADEALDSRLRDALLAAAGDVDAYTVARTTYFCGKPMRLWNERMLRVFRPERVRLECKPASGGTAALHERWVCTGSTGDLAGGLLHFSYPDRRSYRKKFAHYTDIEASGKPFSALRLIGASLLALPRFGWKLFRRKALLDGWRGVYTAWFASWYRAVVAWKAGRE